MNLKKRTVVEGKVQIIINAYSPIFRYYLGIIRLANKCHRVKFPRNAPSPGVANASSDSPSIDKYKLTSLM